MQRVLLFSAPSDVDAKLPERLSYNECQYEEGSDEEWNTDGEDDQSMAVPIFGE